MSAVAGAEERPHQRDQQADGREGRDIRHQQQGIEVPEAGDGVDSARAARGSSGKKTIEVSTAASASML